MYTYIRVVLFQGKWLLYLDCLWSKTRRDCRQYRWAVSINEWQELTSIFWNQGMHTAHATGDITLYIRYGGTEFWAGNFRITLGPIDPIGFTVRPQLKIKISTNFSIIFAINFTSASTIEQSIHQTTYTFMTISIVISTTSLLSNITLISSSVKRVPTNLKIW